MNPTFRFIPLLLLWVCSLPTELSAQQDAIMSQYMFNQLAFNPSYAGINNITNVSLNSRFQWSSFEGAPTSYFFSGSTSIIDGKVGLGASLIYDVLGSNTNTQAQFSYAYKIQQAGKTFSFGLQTGIMNIRVDDTGLNLKVGDDPFFQGNVESATKVNFGAGVSLMSDKYYIGVSVPRMMNSKFESGNVNIVYERHFYFSGAYIFQASPTVKLKPMILLKGVKGAPLSVDINMSALLANKFWVGAFTRNFKTWGGMLQFEFMEAYKIGYSYEILGKSLTGNGLPTNEIMLSADLALFSHQSIFQRFF
ncbi:MAG: type IX secretion system membrane protein PorP/SprF [Cyclobacteriaceae bacterium]|nr:type IX secretion system membrane protein PorP/SprF [Cyclobacteriaceae bacterium]